MTKIKIIKISKWKKNKYYINFWVIDLCSNNCLMPITKFIRLIYFYHLIFEIKYKSKIKNPIHKHHSTTFRMLSLKIGLHLMSFFQFYH